MTRMSKQGKRRAISPRRNRPPSEKTGAKKDLLEQGFKEHFNALSGNESVHTFIPRIK